MSHEPDLSSYQPIPAGGTGAEGFDQPALFYLTHQRVIDEWYGLRRTVSEALNDWFEKTVRQALAPLAHERSLIVSTAYGPQKQAHLLAHPQEMPVINGRPIVGIGVAWPRMSVNPISNGPYACVRRSSSPPGKAAAAALLDAGGRDFRSRESLKGRDDEPWPLYSWIPARPQWWTDLDAYLDTILRPVEQYIDVLAGALAAAALVGKGLVQESSDEDEDPGAPDPDAPSVG